MMDQTGSAPQDFIPANNYSIPINYYNPDFLRTNISNMTTESMDPTYITSLGTDLNQSRAKKTKPQPGIQRCTCHNTSCLKCYCVCFKNNSYCGKDCSCVNCKNNKEHETEVKAAINKTKDAHPNAFSKDLANFSGCKCKKECRKNYCECRKNNINCSASCTCINCQNNKPGSAQQQIPAQEIYLQTDNLIMPQIINPMTNVHLQTQTLVPTSTKPKRPRKTKDEESDDSEFNGSAATGGALRVQPHRKGRYNPMAKGDEYEIEPTATHTEAHDVAPPHMEPDESALPRQMEPQNNFSQQPAFFPPNNLQFPTVGAAPIELNQIQYSNILEPPQQPQAVQPVPEVPEIQPPQPQEQISQLPQLPQLPQQEAPENKEAQQ